jgi:hypothetical protein
MTTRLFQINQRHPSDSVVVEGIKILLLIARVVHLSNGGDGGRSFKQGVDEFHRRFKVHQRTVLCVRCDGRVDLVDQIPRVVDEGARVGLSYAVRFSQEMPFIDFNHGHFRGHRTLFALIPIPRTFQQHWALEEVN